MLSARYIWISSSKIFFMGMKCKSYGRLLSAECIFIVIYIKLKCGEYSCFWCSCEDLNQ